MEINNKDASKCIHCHICQKNCPFLTKYQIDIGDTEKLYDLAYHCFLCGKCSEVCPKGIDGREQILQMRRNQTKDAGGNPPEKGYNFLLLEKKNYLFKNYRHAISGSVLFTGCNFPSFYPRTTQKLANVLKEKAGIGVIYDCCGKPVSELGMQEQEERIIRKLEIRLKERNVTELVILCPNCYVYLKDKLDLRMVSIYEKMIELRIGNKISGEGNIFVPCPDKGTLEWFEKIQLFFQKKCEVIPNVNCCGLGGCAGGKEPKIAKEFSEQLRNADDNKIYTYCGSCAGNLTKNGCKNVKHVLTEIMAMNEMPDTKKSMMNRMKTKLL